MSVILPKGAQRRKVIFSEQNQINIELKDHEEKNNLLKEGHTIVEETPRSKSKSKQKINASKFKRQASGQQDSNNVNTIEEGSQSSDYESDIDDEQEQIAENNENAEKVDDTPSNSKRKEKQVELKLKKESSKKSKQKKLASKQKYHFDDFTLKNYVGRNILHRSCLKMNHSMVKDLIKQYKALKTIEVSKQQSSQFFQAQNEEGGSLLSVAQQLEAYVNELDDFGNTPLILCCIQEVNEELSRKECIKALLDAGADINQRNPRTLWSALHWCCHYGNFECIQVLLKHNLPVQNLEQPSPFSPNTLSKAIYQCFPDFRGYYPLDLAGMKNNKKIVNLLGQHLIEEIKSLERLKNKDLEEDEMIDYTHSQDKLFMKQFRIKYLSSPLLKSRILYWVSLYPGNNSMRYIKDAFGFQQSYIMAIQPHQINMTALHAAAKTKNSEILEFFVDNVLQKNHPDKNEWCDAEYNERVGREFIFSLSSNTILPMIKDEETLYTSTFINHISEFAEWENEYIINLKRTIKQSYIDQQDVFGNTALHLASINGFQEGVIFLLANGANMDIDNKEGWRPRELVQHQNIRQIYQEALEKDRILTNQLREMNKVLETTVREFIEIDESENFSKNKREKELYSYGTKLFLPDFVIVFSLGKDGSNENRMNFQIDVLRKSNFNVYLLESVMPDKFYLLIGMPESSIQVACKQNKIQMKLVDSYEYELFNPDNVTKFEPFRSKQRQEIIEMQLNKIMNLSDLKSQQLISTYYKMHTYGGISRVKCQWIDNKKWWWPQPLNQMADYLLESKDQNFTSMTLLRQYLGEKIAFFFGWKSFITCAQILIAVPGLILQIGILAEKTTDNNNILISFWVLYVMVWSIIIVEFWKRKTSEINYRWGTLEAMNNPEILNKQIRSDFVGDECISSVTGALTKYEKKAQTILKLLLTIPLLAGLMFLVVYIFLIVEDFKKSFTTQTPSFKNNMYKTLAGTLQGVGIQVLNFIYTFFVRKFAEYENHKYEFSYERSIIYKLMAFKILNSYFALFYVAFLQKDSNFSTLFYMLLPILLVKQINATIFNVWLPLFFQKRAERQYFEQINKTLIEHKLNQGQLDPEKIKENQDIIEKFWNDYSREDMENLNRTVVCLKNEKEDPSVSGKGFTSQIKLIRHIDVDSIELNSLRKDFYDTVNYYADSFVDLGYVTLFSAAFPIGPAICLVMNAVEIRNNINSFLYVLKRPSFQRSAGIGQWLFIWQFFSVAAVVSNIGLLYSKDDKLIDLLIDTDKYASDEIRTYKTWLYICSFIAIIFLKYLFQAIIKDKPEWIRHEEERSECINQQIQKEQEKIILGANKINEDEETKRKKEVSKLMGKFEEDIRKKEKEILQLEKEKQFYFSHCPPEKRMLNNESDIMEEGENSVSQLIATRSKTEYSMKLFGVLRSTYIKLEREFMIQRLRQLEKYKNIPIISCSECGEKLAKLDCRKCMQPFCQACFDEYHSFIAQYDHPVKLLKQMNSNKNKPKKDNFMEILPNAHQVKQNLKWKKFEYFSLPTYKKSPLYQCLREIYQMFRKEYIEHNGIDEVNEAIDIKKFFRLREDSSGKGKFIMEETKSFLELSSFQEFNVEDKLFLNRIAFLTFKRTGSKTTYQNFENLCKILQDGLPQQKFILLLDFIDEDDSRMIDRTEVKKIFYTSFLQTSDQDSKIDSVLDSLFQNEKQIDKVDIGKKLIFSDEQDPTLHSFLISLMQHSNDKRSIKMS